MKFLKGITITAFVVVAGICFNVQIAKADTITDSCGKNAQFNLDTETGKLVISGTGTLDGESLRYGPATYDGDWEEDVIPCVTSITIEEGITEIQDFGFFGYINVTEVHLPNSLMAIGQFTLDNTKLYNDFVDKSEDSELIIDGWLYRVRDEIEGEYFVPEGVKKVAKYAIFDNDNLTKVVFPRGVEVISQDCMYIPNAITEVILPEGVKYLNQFAFGSSLIIMQDSNWIDGIMYIGKYAFIKNSESVDKPLAPGQGETCILLDGTLGIAEDCFSNFDGTIIVPTSVTVIGKGNFGDKSTVKSCSAYVEQYCKENNIKFVSNHETELKNYVSASATSNGYSGDQVCGKCGQTVKKGSVIPKTTKPEADAKPGTNVGQTTTNKTTTGSINKKVKPSIKVKVYKRKVKVSIKKMPKAVKYEIKYKQGKKWITRKTKNNSYYIKKLKSKKKVIIKVRAIYGSGKKKSYSLVRKKTVRVK